MRKIKSPKVRKHSESPKIKEKKSIEVIDRVSRSDKKDSSKNFERHQSPKIRESNSPEVSRKKAI